MTRFLKVLKMKKLSKFLVSASMLFAMSAIANSASALTVDATGSGWCNSDQVCNNIDPSVITDTLSGNNTPGGELYRNWFYFQIPAGVYTSAVLSIYNDGRNSADQLAAFYSIFSGNSIKFTELYSGNPLSSITLGDANTGVSHYVDLMLSNEGLDLINSIAGNGFLFGGGTDARNNELNILFGFTDGLPVARLTLEPVVEEPVDPVPEPATWLSMMLGFASLGAAMRRKRVQSLIHQAA